MGSMKINGVMRKMQNFVCISTLLNKAIEADPWHDERIYAQDLWEELVHYSIFQLE